MIWRCNNCGEPLGETLSTGEMKLRLTKAKSYIVGYPITTSCVKCRELNKIASSDEICEYLLPSAEAEIPSTDGEVSCSDEQNAIELTEDNVCEILGNPENQERTVKLVGFSDDGSCECKVMPITQEFEREPEPEQ